MSEMDENENVSNIDSALLSRADLLDAEYPNRPKNTSPSLRFRDLVCSLFEAMVDLQHKPHTRKGSQYSAVESRRNVINRFIQRWRNEVGPDIYPAFRLIMPDRDKDRPMYGLKEASLGKMLVVTMGIGKDSEDALAITKWKLPGQAKAAGDFGGRCFEILSKRPFRDEFGEMTIDEVNDLLDRLSAVSKEKDQQPILTQFYRSMNPTELKWLVRIILRQMRVGATEKTFFDCWHPDADKLFNVSSSLRKVCWDLYDPESRLEDKDTDIKLFQCYQPQLANFNKRGLQQVVDAMGGKTFWIEEKLDGERIQLHKRDREFRFFSRKAKDYTYLYGSSLDDEDSSLTRHLKDAFIEDADEVILDGEMIAWDPVNQAIVPFGNLKTAALTEKENRSSKDSMHPLYIVFDILYLNQTSLTRYPLYERRAVLHRIINPVERRFEIHNFSKANTVQDIEIDLRKIIAEGSEGLVVKDPNSPYQPSARVDSWIKVKPDYMKEFGEELDVLIIGGYYGEGKRGGRHSSFLCGLRVNGNPPLMKFHSFLKVGGGFAAEDYAKIRHITDGHWNEWDPNNPPMEYIELADAKQTFERPDQWIKPDKSIVVQVKAAQVAPTDQFRTKITLRFPRFQRIREDKDWTTALSYESFNELKQSAETQHKESQMSVINRRQVKRVKREYKIMGDAGELYTEEHKQSAIFSGKNFYVMTAAETPVPLSKADLESFVRQHSGAIFQSENARKHIVVIADKELIKVASLKARATHDILRPRWLLDSVAIGFILPLEPRYALYLRDRVIPYAQANLDDFCDSYTSPVNVDELRDIITKMTILNRPPAHSDALLNEIFRQDDEIHSLGRLFAGCVAYLDHADGNPGICSDLRFVHTYLSFGKADVVDSLDNAAITHVIVSQHELSRLFFIRLKLSQRSSRVPRVVTSKWVSDSVEQLTLLDEGRYAP